MTTYLARTAIVGVYLAAFAVAWGIASAELGLSRTPALILGGVVALIILTATRDWRWGR